MLKDTFITHGVLCLCNWGGLEIQLNECGDGARVRDNYGGEKRNKTRWQQIKYDRQGEPFIIHTPAQISSFRVYESITGKADN